jgi:hypothetical protein
VAIRSLHRRLGRLAEATGLRRCTCGAILPASVTKPRRLEIADEYNLPDSLKALVPLATPAEAQELQALLNRCLELHPDLAGRHGTSHRIYGGQLSDSALLRFHFADAGAAGPHCPQCGMAVASDNAVRAVAILAPPPNDLLEILRLDPPLAAQFMALTTTWRPRASVQTGPAPHC